MSRKRAALCVLGVGVAALSAWLATPFLQDLLTKGTNDGPGQPNQAASLVGVGPMPLAKSLEHRFAAEVQPFLQRYCISCHGSKKPKSSLDLSRDSTVAAVAANAGHWEP